MNCKHNSMEQEQACIAGDCPVCLRARVEELEATCVIKNAALESAIAGVWDGYYGHGVTAEYAHAVDAEVKKALIAGTGNKTIQRFYVASKVKHAEMWCALRDSGHQIVSTWIDEAGEGQTYCYQELSKRCVSEIASCDALVLYCEPQEQLKGALVEAGIALALGKEIRCVGESPSLSRVFKCHPKWMEYESIDAAMKGEAK